MVVSTSIRSMFTRSLTGGASSYYVCLIDLVALRLHVWSPPAGAGLALHVEQNDIVAGRGVQCPAWSPSSDYVELLDLVLAQSWHDRYWGTGPSYVILTLDMHYANTHFKHKGINKSWSKVKVMCRIYWPFQVRDYRNSNINIFRLRSISSNILWILLKLIL